MLKIFSGDNDYELKAEYKAAVDAFIRQHGDLAVERFDGEEASVESIKDAILSVPFLSPAKLVIITSTGSKELFEPLLELDIPQSAEVIIVASKLDKRASYYKKLSKLPGFKSFEASSAQSLPSWVVKEAKVAGGTISLTDARYLVEYIGPNQLMLKNEIEKLVLYVKVVTKATIDELCDPSPQSTVFQLVDAAFAGNQKRAEQLYHEQRAQKVEPQAIMGMLAWQLHILALVKSAESLSPDMIAKQAKLNPFVVKKTLTIARRLTMSQVKKFVRDAHELDIVLKSRPIDADDAMTVFLLKLATH